MKSLLNRRYDIAGNELLRVVKFSAFAKFVPVGNLRGGPGLRCLVVMFILHYFGSPLYTVLAKYGQKMSILGRIASTLRM
jgi:hypothetical protein